MKAVTYTPDQGFALVEVETPQLGPDEVLLQVEACGVCGSDRQVVAGESVPTGTAFPLVMGHEIAGRIAALGETVTDWHVGDSVIVHPFVACGTCAPCVHGQPNLCVRQVCIGYQRPGGFAEQVAVPARQLVRRPAELAPAAAALVVDAFATPYHAMRAAGVESGQTVLIIGTGGLGLAALMLAMGFHVGRLGAVTRRQEGIAIAEAHGAQMVVVTDQDERTIARQLRRWSGASGIDVVIDTVATADTITLAAESVRPGGTIAIVGMSADTALYPVAKTVRRGLTFVASYGSVREDVEQLVSWVAEGRLDPVRLVAGALPLHEAARAFAPDRPAGRWVIVPSE
ncbi:alcohol dehydrogenase catalytic domain-containing protein [Alicyclobacillus suci]|uniref:alcohol dehydrogenase catalytic domain-containing protein n=1 Tax=Alicyclobacillus suci TaxID=2816080 RepID=UPI001A8C15EE|nr:alcohol dehydrogenase catalytic domain-containing protein [Alicyclobacillus suci]